MEVGGRPIQKTEAVTNSSNPFQTRRCLPVLMGEQDMQVLMPHGNWSWGPFSQLANQLTGCRRKTTARTLPGLPIPGCKPPRDFLMAEFLGNPGTAPPPPVDKAVGLASSSRVVTPLPWQSSGSGGLPTSDKEPATPGSAATSPLPLFFVKQPFIEKPSANQWWYCAEFSSREFATNKSYQIVLLSSE